MKSNELRVGNWVTATKGNNYEGKGVIQVRSISGSGINQWQDMGASGEERYEDVAGIPLTEEWLLKFGVDGKDLLIPNYHNTILRLSNSDYMLMIQGYEGDKVELKRPKYVHQLQNLYHALTGEELTIKEPAT